MLLKDITHKIFGVWKPIKYLGEKIWLCKCIKCSHEHKLNSSNLRKKPHCKKCQRSPHLKDLTNKIFGNIKVLRLLDEKYANGKAFWECVCLTCKRKSKLPSNNIKRHSIKTKKCFCYLLDGNPINEHFASAKRRAKERNYSFNLTKKFLLNLIKKQNYKCAISGQKLSLTMKRSGETTASLDRIDSNKGYTFDNVQWIHKDINRMKSDFLQNDFIKICILIANHNKER